MEEWRELTDYPEYSVSNLGAIRRRNRILKQSLNDSGYYKICLSKNGQAKTFSVARLTALMWLPPVEGKLTVDHINRIRTDNRLENIRWANGSEQCLNRICPLGAVGERHICKQGKWFKVQVKRENRMIYSKTFCTLDAAKEARDSFLQSFQLVE